MEVPLYASPSALAGGVPTQVRCSVARPLAAHCSTCPAEQLSDLLLGTDANNKKQQQQPNSCRSAASVLDVLGMALVRPCETGRPMLQLLSQIVSSLRRIFTFFMNRSVVADIAQSVSSSSTQKQQQQQSPWENKLFTSAAAAEYELFARIALDACEALACMVHADVVDSELNCRALELICDVLVVGGGAGGASRGGARLPGHHTSKVLRRLAHVVSRDLFSVGASRSADRVQTFSVLIYCLAACGTAADSQCWHHCVRTVRGADSEIDSDISKSKNLELVACWHRAASCFARALVDAGRTPASIQASPVSASASSMTAAAAAAAAAAVLTSSPSRGNAIFSPDAPLLFINWCETGRETMPHLGLRWLARSFALVLSFFAPATVHPASAIPVAAVYADIAGTLRTAPNLDAGTALRWFGMPVVVACGTEPGSSCISSADASTTTAPNPDQKLPISPDLKPTAAAAAAATGTASFDLLITSLEALTIIGARFVASEHPETIAVWKALTAQTVNSLLLLLPAAAASSTSTDERPRLSAAKLDDATRFLKNFHDVVGRCRNHLTWAHLYRHAILKVVPEIVALVPSSGGAASESGSRGISDKTWASVAHHLSVAATSDFLWTSWDVVSQLCEHVRWGILALEAQRAAVVASVATLVVHARTSHEKPVAVARVMCDFSAAVLGALKDRLAPQMVSGTDADAQLRGVLSLLQCITLLPWSFVAVESSSYRGSSSNDSSSSSSEFQHHDDFATKLEDCSAEFHKLLSALSSIVDAVATYLHDREMLAPRSGEGASSNAGDSGMFGAGGSSSSVGDSSSSSTQSLVLAAFYWLIQILSRVAGLLPPSCRRRGFEVAARVATQGLAVPVAKEAYFLRTAAAHLFFQTTVTFAAARLPDSFVDEGNVGGNAERVTVFAVGAERIVSLVQLREEGPEEQQQRDAATKKTNIVAFIRSPFGRCSFRFRRVPPTWSSLLATTPIKAAASGGDQQPASSSSPSVAATRAARQDPLAAKNDPAAAVGGVSPTASMAEGLDDLADVLFPRRVRLDAGGSSSSSNKKKKKDGDEHLLPIEDKFPLLRHLAREFTLQTTNWKLLAFNPGLASQLRGLDRAAEELPELVIPVEAAPAWWSPPLDQRIDVERRQERFEAFLAALGTVVKTRASGTRLAEFRCDKRGAVLRFVLSDKCERDAEKTTTSKRFPIVLRFGEPDAAPQSHGSKATATTTTSLSQKQQQPVLPRTASMTKGRSSSTVAMPHFSSSFSAAPATIHIGVTPVEGCGLLALKMNGTVTRNVGKTGVAMELAACATLIRDVCLLHFAEHVQPHLLVSKREALRRVIASADPFRDGAQLEASPANVVCELMHQNEIQT